MVSSAAIVRLFQRFRHYVVLTILSLCIAVRLLSLRKLYLRLLDILEGHPTKCSRFLSDKCGRRIAIGLWSDGRKADAGITLAMSFHRHSDRNE
jgi:hypothetical protein